MVTKAPAGPRGFARKPRGEARAYAAPRGPARARAKAFGEHSCVILTRDLSGEDAEGRRLDLPAGASGAIVGVAAVARVYAVEFFAPVHGVMFDVPEASLALRA